ncbi:hypothetical protein ACET3Z_028691 [Daucus carota]
MTIKAIGHRWYRSAPLQEGDLSATKCLKRESIGTVAVAYNFGRPSNLSEWGIPVGNNHVSSCGSPVPGEDNLLFLLLNLPFADGGPMVGNNTHKQLDRRGLAVLLLDSGAVRSEKQRMS